MIKEIWICYKGKDAKLDVHHWGHYATWNPDRDDEWLIYRNARNVIAKHKRLDRILCKLRLI